MKILIQSCFALCARMDIRNCISAPINRKCVVPCVTYPTITYLHLCHVHRLVDEYPSGRLVARRDGDGALVGYVTRGVRIKVSYVQAHQ